MKEQHKLFPYHSFLIIPFKISRCPEELIEKCKELDGDEFANIQHIPNRLVNAKRCVYNIL